MVGVRRRFSDIVIDLSSAIYNHNVDCIDVNRFARSEFFNKYALQYAQIIERVELFDWFTLSLIQLTPSCSVFTMFNNGFALFIKREQRRAQHNRSTTSRCIRFAQNRLIFNYFFFGLFFWFCLAIKNPKFTFASFAGLFPTPSPNSPDAVGGFCSSIVCKLGFSMTSFCIGFRNYTSRI